MSTSAAAQTQVPLAAKMPERTQAAFAPPAQQMPVSTAQERADAKSEARMMAGIEVVGGALEVAIGGLVTVASGGLLGIAGGAAVVDGGARFMHGVNDFINGERTDPYLSQAAQAVGVERDTANRIDAAVGLTASVATGGLGVKAAMQGGTMLAKGVGTVAATNSANTLYRAGEYVATGESKPTWANQAAYAMGATSPAANSAATLAITATLAGGNFAAIRTAAPRTTAPITTAQHPVYGGPAFPHLANLPETGKVGGGPVVPNARSPALPPLVDRSRITDFVNEATPLLADAKARIAAAPASAERTNLLNRAADMEQVLSDYGQLARQPARPNVTFDNIDLIVLNRDLGAITNSRLALTTPLPSAAPATAAAPATPDAATSPALSVVRTRAQAIKDEQLRLQVHRLIDTHGPSIEAYRSGLVREANRPTGMNGATPRTRATMADMNATLMDATSRIATAQQKLAALPGSARRDQLTRKAGELNDQIRHADFRLNNAWGTGPADISRLADVNLTRITVELRRIEDGIRALNKAP